MSKNVQFPPNFPEEEDLFRIIMNTSRIVWNESLTKKNIKDWLDNFKGECYDLISERRLALWLFSQCTYYNKDEVKNLCKVVFHDLIHDVVSDKDLKINDEEIFSFLKESVVVQSEKISGSGGFVAYFFRQVNNLPMKFFQRANGPIDENVRNLIVLDDVAINGGESGQLNQFLKRLRKEYPHKNIYVITLLASEEAKNKYSEDYSLKFISAITLDDRDKCFHQKSNLFNEHKSLLEETKNLVIHYGRKLESIIKVPPLGYNDSECMFGFFYNTPDNTLPIFWANTSNWKPILKRFQKKYNGEFEIPDVKYL